ncbi:MAG: WecB/TagA/CpsF family glycosyltransferase [Dehalococcoidia bacterium]
MNDFIQLSSNIQSIQIGKIKVDHVGLAQAVAQIDCFVNAGTPHQVVTANMRFLSLAQHDREFAWIVNRSALVVADGMPLVWLSKLMGTPLPARVTGGDLLNACAELAADRRYSVFLLGARPGVAEESGRRLSGIYPGLEITGTHHGYLSGDEEEHKVLREIRDAQPQMLFVAMGCPKQEQWIYRNLADLQVPVCMGIGGVLEVVAGRLKTAPVWMQGTGLEWTYRLKQEPRRLWKRYLIEDIPTGLRLGTAALVQRTRTSTHAGK